MTTVPDPLCILYLTPYYYTARGNAATAGRMKTYLEKAGHEVMVYAFEEEDSPLDEKLERADIVHALHARRAAEFVEAHRLRIRKPLVVTSGGTDINIDLQDAVKKQNMEQFLADAGAVTVFTGDAEQKIVESFPRLSSKVTVIPQGVDIPPEKPEAVPVLPEGSPKLLLPAGLRPVKDVLYVCSALQKNLSRFPDLQLLVLGEEMDEQVKKEVEQAEQELSWFFRYPPVKRKDMSGFYQWADVVLNTSVSEGQPMSLLEGMMHGVPALARKNGGSESVIAHGRNGWLFSTPQEFVEILDMLMRDTSLYRQAAGEAEKYAARYHCPEEEAAEYTFLYDSLLR
ncbi:glycosyltransferase [Salibacterium halotolerans]|uniref:Glycosyltransferase involved in cell wall bisynthesis n=1 Tax=Salibacterium halotolerans TaxID=1884432 RepID=A0A1I5UUA8_9BACI|nr:glycosyltransferase [Salibacterium halotolerans]SFP98841.1 Glycosyltransferase involved in cell wall bisynthesis [Salibacterium halotolerans]